MKKFLKIAIVLMALGLMAMACSKVKTTNLIGTYRSGNSTMTVDANGEVNFSIDQNDTENYNVFQGIYSVDLIPWDLTSEKPSYSFSDSGTIQTGSYPNYTEEEYTINFNFTKDNETVNCSVSLSRSDNISASMNFSK